MVTGAAPDVSSGTVDQIVQRLRDPQTSRTVSAATGLPEEEVRNNLAQMADKAEAARDNPAQAAADVRQGMQSMAERARAEGRLTQAAERAKEAGSEDGLDYVRCNGVVSAGRRVRSNVRTACSRGPGGTRVTGRVSHWIV